MQAMKVSGASPGSPRLARDDDAGSAQTSPARVLRTTASPMRWPTIRSRRPALRNRIAHRRLDFKRRLADIVKRAVERLGVVLASASRYRIAAVTENGS